MCILRTCAGIVFEVNTPRIRIVSGYESKHVRSETVTLSCRLNGNTVPQTPRSTDLLYTEKYDCNNNCVWKGSSKKKIKTRINIMRGTATLLRRIPSIRADSMTQERQTRDTKGYLMASDKLT
eukprot:TRINITY_DN7302_c0_g1_i4.p2 TRINITY_DN7302_c0_g1~~TRINITY_DN7302_c0_g1_i4.p2  ORF type:complete len:123 (-),score=7.68 TRINITY_DN7302_c0_g1_i4:481-849(-)